MSCRARLPALIVPTRTRSEGGAAPSRPSTLAGTTIGAATAAFKTARRPAVVAETSVRSDLIGGLAFGGTGESVRIAPNSLCRAPKPNATKLV